jgi:hypothetical protein
MIRILVEGKKKEIGCNLNNTGKCQEINEGMLFPVTHDASKTALKPCSRKLFQVNLEVEKET